MNLQDIGRVLVFCGLIAAAAGSILIFAGKSGWIGRLPGDIFFKKGNVTFYFPAAACIVLSILASLIFFLFSRK